MSTVGCELGTARIIGARLDDDAGIRQRMLPCCYLEVTDIDPATLTALGLEPVSSGGHTFVIGAEALTAALVLGVAPRRPLATGLLNADDPIDPLAVSCMLREVLGRAVVVGEVCYFAVPPPVVDAVSYDVERHRACVTRLLAALGYTGRAVPTPLALLHSATAAALYFDQGLTQAAIYYDSNPVVSFSSANSGHWLDQQVALVTGMATEQAYAIRTQTDDPVDLTNPTTTVEQRISEFTFSIIYRVLQRLAAELQVTPLPAAVPLYLLVAGEVAQAQHFIDVVRQAALALAPVLPTWSDIRLAPNPQLAVVDGLVARPL
jgi:hypothetical protein